jgi:DtxR family transcriptional regulator, Mn-dependent transcriptional regulator
MFEYADCDGVSCTNASGPRCVPLAGCWAFAAVFEERRSRVATETAENYLKAIYLLGRESPTGEAGMTRIAAAVGVTTGTATTMVKKLSAGKFARYERFGGVTLTPKGVQAALDILRRHRLVETFLVRTLGLDWSVVHDEAERLEHAISPRVLEALDRHLGHPAFDPHGDPIPGADGALAQRDLVPLSQCPAGASVILAQALDQREAALTFLRRHGLEVGAKLRVTSVEPGAGTLTVVNDAGEVVALSDLAARRVLVQVKKPGVMVSRVSDTAQSTGPTRREKKSR